MLILAVVALEIARNPGQLVDLLSLCFARHYGGRRWYHYLLNGLKLLTLAVFVFALATKAQTSAKTVKYALYAVVLIFFIDLQIYLYQYRNALRRLLDGVTRHVYLAVIFPAAIWVLVHPDRVSSILGTQQHVQDASRSFFFQHSDRRLRRFVALYRAFSIRHRCACYRLYPKPGRKLSCGQAQRRFRSRASRDRHA